jgi:hypothetical protein
VSFQFERLADIEEEIKYRFGAAGVKNRHPQPNIRRLINTGWAMLREIVSLANDASFLTATDPDDLPTTAAVTGEVYAEVDFPVDAVDVYGVRVLVSSHWYPLKRIPWAAYQDYQYTNFYEGFTSVTKPRAFIPRTIPEGVGSTETPGKVMILPVPTGGTYRLWYMKAWQRQLDDGYTFGGHAEWIEWVKLQTLIKMADVDRDGKRQRDGWMIQAAECRALIEARAQRIGEAMGLEPRNARFDGEDPDDFGFGGPL